MSAPSSISRAIAAFQGKDDPLSVENERLSTENAELKTKVESFEGLMQATVSKQEEQESIIASLKGELATAKETAAFAAQAKTEAEAKAATAEAAATAAKTAAAAEIAAKEASVEDRAAKMAADQLSAAGQPPANLPGTEGKPASNSSTGNPQSYQPRNQQEALAHGAAHWASRSKN